MANDNHLISVTRYNVTMHNFRMFIIEGMDKVRDIIEKNRKRKLTNHQPK